MTSVNTASTTLSGQKEEHGDSKLKTVQQSTVPSTPSDRELVFLGTRSLYLDLYPEKEEAKLLSKNIHAHGRYITIITIDKTLAEGLIGALQTFLQECDILEWEKKSESERGISSLEWADPD